MVKNYDIIIIGGGLVGASLAVALAEKDLSIAIIEASSAREINPYANDARAIVLSESTKKIFQTLKIWIDLAGYITPITMVHISDRGHFGVTRIQAKDCNLSEVGNAISAPALAMILYKQLEVANNVSWIRPAKVTEISNDYVVINDEKIIAKLIVIADGVNSQTIKLLGIDNAITDYNQSAVVANITLDREHKNIAYERFTAEGPIALLPVRGGCMTAVWTMTHDKAKQCRELSEEKFLHALQEAFGFRAGKFLQATQRMIYPLNLSLSDSQEKNGILILGNAAHALHPVSGQGFNLGLRDVAELAEIILSYGKEKISDVKLIKDYLLLRKRDQDSTVRYTDDLIRLFSSDAFPLTPLRGFGLSALNNFPPLKKIIAKRAMGFRGRASKLLRGISLMKN